MIYRRILSVIGNWTKQRLVNWWSMPLVRAITAHVNLSLPDGPNTNAVSGSYSLSVDGNDDHVSIAPNASLDLSGGLFTQSIWIYPEHTDSGYHGILGYQGAGTAQRYPGIWVQNQTQIHAGFGDGVQWNSFSTGSVLTPFEWNHVVTTFDGTAYKVYVDAVEVYSTNALAGRTPAPTQQLDIGRVDNHVNALIDDVRIYKRALTSEDVTLLFTGALGDVVPPTASLVNVNVAAGATTEFTVSYSDNQAIDVTTLDNTDIRVTGPAGFNQLASLVSVNDNTNGTPRTAVYGITTPTDNGTYSVLVEPNQVSDTNANTVVADFLGTFEIVASGEPDPTGLVGHWKLEQTAIGQSVVDSSGSGNHGVHVNLGLPDGPNTNAAVGTYGLSVDGNDDYVSIAPDASLDLSGGLFTQSIWIYPEHTDSGYHGILGYQGAGTAQRYPGMWVQNQTQIHAGFGDGAQWNSFSTGSVLTPFDWNHVVTTFDGTAYKVYVDAVEVFSTNALAGRTPAPTQQLDIGRVDNHVNALLDDVRIYKRVLDASEVTLLRNLGSASPGTIALQSSSFNVNETESVVSIPVVRSGGSQGTVTVQYATSSGTATSPSDYTTATGTLTFLTGETNKTINVPIINDVLSEGPESFQISLSSVMGGASLGTPNVGSVTVSDDEVAELTLTIGAAAISEGAGATAATATVSRNDADLSAALVVTLLSDDLSEATVPATVIIPAGQSISGPLHDHWHRRSDRGRCETVTVTASAVAHADGPIRLMSPMTTQRV